MKKHGPGYKLIQKRHREWQEHHVRWRWLLDSYEGGQRYRDAVYGFDTQGLPIRNLVRHKREYPAPGSEASALPFGGDDWPAHGQVVPPPMSAATDDDYELRRSRTPVPTFLAEAVETHLSRIYAREVVREGPENLRQWWNDINGCGMNIDQWMVETIAPLLLTLGQIDVIMDRPRAPKGAVVENQADCVLFGLDHCIAGYILPENMIWWRLDESSRRYEECLVAETMEVDGAPVPVFRHWTVDKSTLFDANGFVIESVEHHFGRVPIERLFLSRKSRTRNVGQSRYEGIAERQREYYNRDSELILSDTLQAHPLMQGPEDLIQPDGSIPIGPGWLLPMKKNNTGSSISYKGFEVVDFKKDGAESIRRNKADIRDDVDRDSALVRSVDRAGVPQSGVAKTIDLHDGNNRLAKLAKTLARAERLIVRLAVVILNEGQIDKIEEDLQVVRIEYPSEFDLLTTSELADATRVFQKIVESAGRLPRTESLLLSRLLRLCMPGLSDESYLECDAEIKNYLKQNEKKS
jgi:hypothetical protein